MIYALTLNVAIDKYLEVNTLNIGNTNYYHDYNNIVGGKSINVCKILNEFTKDYMLISTTDETNKDLVMHELKELNKQIFIDDHSRVNYKVNNNGQITEINQKVEALSTQTKEAIGKYLINNISQEDYLLIAGSFNNLDKAFLIELCQQINTTNIVIDSSAFNMEDLKIIKPLMIKPNEEEIEILIEGGEDLNTKIKVLLDLGISDVITTLGGDGVKYNLDEVIKPKPGTVINTVGAGDSFVGGYLYAKHMQYKNEQMLNFAQACGSATAYSTDIAKKEEIINLLK